MEYRREEESRNGPHRRRTWILAVTILAAALIVLVVVPAVERLIGASANGGAGSASPLLSLNSLGASNSSGVWSYSFSVTYASAGLSTPSLGFLIENSTTQARFTGPTVSLLDAGGAASSQFSTRESGWTPANVPVVSGDVLRVSYSSSLEGWTFVVIVTQLHGQSDTVQLPLQD